MYFNITPDSKSNSNTAKDNLLRNALEILNSTVKKKSSCQITTPVHRARVHRCQTSKTKAQPLDQSSGTPKPHCTNASLCSKMPCMAGKQAEQENCHAAVT